MKLKIIIDWLISIYEENGNLDIKLNDMSMEDIDLEDFFNIELDKNIINIDGIQDYRE